jgi:hypothetical protein
VMQDRQGKCGGLAGSGLGDSDYIAARHHGRYHLHLDRGWSEVFFFRETTRNCVVKSEFGK